MLPRPPQFTERIVFITDTMSGGSVPPAANYRRFAVDAIQSEVVRLYGPQAGGQVSRNLLSFLFFHGFMAFS